MSKGAERKYREREFKEGIMDGRYKEVLCKLCGYGCGWVPKWAWVPGAVIYCNMCREGVLKPNKL